MRVESRSDEVIELLDNLNKMYFKKEGRKEQLDDESNLKIVYIICHHHLKCPYCDGETIFEYSPDGDGIRSLWCWKCGWIDDFDHIQDILGERETKIWRLKPEIMVFNPFLVCPVCDKKGMVEFLSDYREVKFIACLHCGEFNNECTYIDRKTIEKERWVEETCKELSNL